MVSGLNLMLVLSRAKGVDFLTAFLLFSDYNVDIPGLVNVYITTMENPPIFNGKSHYFYGHF